MFADAGLTLAAIKSSAFAVRYMLGARFGF
jgi:hypothetical protein